MKASKSLTDKLHDKGLRTVRINSFVSFFNDSRATLSYAAGTGCNYLTRADDALNAATQWGVNVNSFNHVLYLLPANVNCPWAGIAYLGCNTSCEAWVVTGGDITGLMAHELGHNIGLDHSSPYSTMQAPLLNMEMPPTSCQLHIIGN